MEPDGTLRDWNEIANEYEWDTLLLGNGLSINVWEPFNYRELYARAHRGAGLTPADRRLFKETPNFERVLADLLTAIRVNECVGVESAPLYARYRNIQVALGHAVRRVHVNQGRIPSATLTRIREVMERFEWVFSTSYDLIVYWAMACERNFDPFMDLFRGDRLEFDPRTRVPKECVPVYFLTGRCTSSSAVRAGPGSSAGRDLTRSWTSSASRSPATLKRAPCSSRRGPRLTSSTRSRPTHT